MNTEYNIPSPLFALNDPLFDTKGLAVYLKRDDLIHSEISGNKWRKLKLYFEKFKLNNYDAILTFGGAFSNHIAATAKACFDLEYPCIGVIRGDELNSNSNETLIKASKNKMRLEFVSRTNYKLKTDKEYLQGLRNRFGNVLIIPEGGYGFHGMIGCTTILAETANDFDYIATSAGTATTLTGLMFAKSEKTKVLSFPALNKGDFLDENITELLVVSGFDDSAIKELKEELFWHTEYAFGGYGKYNEELITFINEFYSQHKIVLDQIYTGKMMFGLMDLIKKDYFPEGSKIMALHTGGIQGLKSISHLLNDDVQNAL